MLIRRCAQNLVLLGSVMLLGGAECETDDPDSEARAHVDGALDNDVIRRIVRAHIDDVRYCYNQGLVDDPDLAGRVVVRFVIDADGAIQESELEDNLDDDEDVGECIAEAVKMWKFPKPRGGEQVEVSYPFVLSPG